MNPNHLLVDHGGAVTYHGQSIAMDEMVQAPNHEPIDMPLAGIVRIRTRLFHFVFLLTCLDAVPQSRMGAL